MSFAINFFLGIMQMLSLVLLVFFGWAWSIFWGLLFVTQSGLLPLLCRQKRHN